MHLVEEKHAWKSTVPPLDLLAFLKDESDLFSFPFGPDVIRTWVMTVLLNVCTRSLFLPPSSFLHHLFFLAFSSSQRYSRRSSFSLTQFVCWPTYFLISTRRFTNYSLETGPDAPLPLILFPCLFQLLRFLIFFNIFDYFCL